MATPAIVEHFNILEQRLFRFLHVFVLLVMNQFAFERAEEALGDPVVVTVALTAHARFNSMIRKDLPILLAGILNSPIAVMQHPLRGPAMCQGHAEGSARELGSQVIRRGPTDDATRASIKNHRQVQPAFNGRDIRDVDGLIANDKFCLTAAAHLPPRRSNTG
jgi:hypothetical protein